MFYKAGFVESWGKGTNNVVTDCKKMNLPEPDYKYTQKAIQVFLYKTVKKTTPKTTSKTTKEMLITLIQEDKFITREALSEKLKIGINGVKQHILKLKKEGTLERIGDNRNGYWKVVK